MNHSIIILFAGGTFGMKEVENKLIVAPGEEIYGLLMKHNQLYNYEETITYLPSIDSYPQGDLGDNPSKIYFLSLPQPIDSSNATPNDWKAVGSYIAEIFQKDNQTNFLIIHGTDTLSWTAAALYHCLDKINSTIILTAAQIPLIRNDTDAFTNFSRSLNILKKWNNLGVCAFFGSELFFGVGLVKFDANSMDAFKCLKYKPHGKYLSDGFNLLKDNKEDDGITPTTDFIVYEKEFNFANVGYIQLFPGLSIIVMEKYIEFFDGIVVGAYGSGNLPTNDNYNLLDLLDTISESKPVVLITQCLNGSIDNTPYEGKSKYLIKCRDMTIEGSVTKLAYIIGETMFKKKN